MDEAEQEGEDLFALVLEENTIFGQLIVRVFKVDFVEEHMAMLSVKLLT